MSDLINWRLVPNWAEYVTFDQDLTPMAHEKPATPFLQNGTWMSDGKKMIIGAAINKDAEFGLDWRVACFRRPAVRVEQINDSAPLSALEILASAPRHIKDRAVTYDKPDGERSMGKTVAMFNACHGTNITEEQGWHFMELVKHVRFFTAKQYHADSMEDGINYAALRGETRANAK